MNFKQKFEPIGNKILHGAGQSPSQFQKYWNVSKNQKPAIYMEYVKLFEVKTTLEKKISNILKISPNLCLQLGLNLKPRNDSEKCKEISEGKYDDEINFLIDKLIQFGNPVFLRMGYECNDPTHGYDSKYFKEAWSHIEKIIKVKCAILIIFT